MNVNNFSQPYSSVFYVCSTNSESHGGIRGIAILSERVCVSNRRNRLVDPFRDIWIVRRCVCYVCAYWFIRLFTLTECKHIRFLVLYRLISDSTIRLATVQKRQKKNQQFFSEFTLRILDFPEFKHSHAPTHPTQESNRILIWTIELWTNSFPVPFSKNKLNWFQHVKKCLVPRSVECGIDSFAKSYQITKINKAKRRATVINSKPIISFDVHLSLSTK